jgi:hypothetical protein
LWHEKRGGSNSFDVTHTYDPASNRTAQTDSGHPYRQRPKWRSSGWSGSSKVNPKEAARSMALILWIGSKAFLGLDQS